MHGSTKNSKEGLEFEAILLHTGIYLSGVGSKLRTRGGRGRGEGGGVDLSNIMTSKKIYMVKVLFNFRKKLGEG